MISTSHENAEFYFQRDVKCVQQYFEKHYGLEFEGIPTLESKETEKEVDLDKEVRASGFIKQELGKDDVKKAFDQVAQGYLEPVDGVHEDEDEDEDMDGESQESE